MLIVIRLNFRVRGCFLQRGSIQLDVAHTELFWSNEVILVLLVIGVNVRVANLLLRRQSIHIDGRFTYHALLCNQGCQLFRLTFEHEISANDGIDELLGCQLITQSLSVLIGSHAHLINDAVVTRIVEFAVRLESLSR